MHTFSIEECFKFGWQTFKARPWFFVALFLIIIGISIMLGLSEAFLTLAIGKVLGSLVHAVLAIASSMFYAIGLITIYLKAHDDVHAPTLKDLWQPRYFWNYLGFFALFILIVGVGFVLLIIPGIILALTFGLGKYLVIDRGLGPVEALKESRRITKGSRLKLFLLMLVIILLNIVGTIAFLVGLFVTVPVSLLALVHAYRVLEKNKRIAVIDTTAEKTSDIPATTITA